MSDSPPGLEQLDGIPGWVVDDDLRAAGTGHDVGRTKRHAGGSQPLDVRFEIAHLEVNAIPPTRQLRPAVGEWALARAPVAAQQQANAAARYRGKRGRGVLLESE